MPTSVLVIDSQPLVRLGLRAVACLDTDISIIGEASDGASGLEIFRKSRADLVLIGLRLPDLCAAEDLGKFFEIDSTVKIIVCAGNAGDAEIESSLALGATGIVTDHTTADELVNAIKTVASGDKYIPDDVAKTLSAEIPKEKLTNAETAVLRMLVGGMSNKEIAFALNVSENTVKTHVRHIFEKLNVSDRTTATVTAIKRGLVRVDI